MLSSGVYSRLVVNVGDEFKVKGIVPPTYDMRALITREIPA